MQVDLTSYKEHEELSHKFGSHSLSSESANAIATTTLQLHHASNKSLNSFLPDHLTIISPFAQKSPDSDALNYLRTLALSAEKAATSLSCSSILLGQTSESDYLGDVAVWLGSESSFAQGHERDVIKALGLETWADQDIVPVSLETEDKVPPSIASSASSPTVKAFIQNLKGLDERYCFRLSKPGAEGSAVVFFLIGKVQADAWGGLIGMGTWSDE